MRVLVTGGGGFLGSVLVPRLLARGYDVRVLDAGYFGLEQVTRLSGRVEIVKGDLRSLAEDRAALERLVAECDEVMHLAAISNDPSADLSPELTDVVNRVATGALAKGARKEGARFVFASSASLYGDREGEQGEEDEIAPLSLYAVSKAKAEESLLALETGDWSPVVLRMGTLFGCSPRMRFDLVVNVFSWHITTDRKLRVFGDGLQWRPYLSVADAADAFIHFGALRTQGHVIFNIAHENMRVIDVAETVRRIDPRASIEHVPVETPDPRSYRMRTDRMRSAGFRTTIDVATGAREIVEAITSGRIADPPAGVHRNAQWMRDVILAL